MEISIFKKISAIHAIKCAKTTNIKIATSSFDKLQEIKIKLESTPVDQINAIIGEIEDWKSTEPIVNDSEIKQLIKG
ncbi:MAG: hypothetical protein KYX68_09035 [Flavobacterium sp.]|nr:hypothetical protein [Flavobacterium sp.]